jgi:hypothetical protein
VAEGALLAMYDSQTGAARKTWRAASADGTRSSIASTIRHAPRRGSFVVSFATLPEIWEISHDPAAEPIYQGLVHDFRLGEGVPEPGFLGVRRSRLEAALPVFTLDASGSYVIGLEAGAAAGRALLAVVHLDVRRRIARFTLAGQPVLEGARDIRAEGREWVHIPDAAGGPGWRLDLRNDRLTRAER